MLTIHGPILLKRASSHRIPKCHVLIIIVLVNMINDHTARVPEVFIKIKWNRFAMFEQQVFSWQVPMVDPIENVRKFCCFCHVRSIMTNHDRIGPPHFDFRPCTHMPRTRLIVHLSIWIRLEYQKMDGYSECCTQLKSQRSFLCHTHHDIISSQSSYVSQCSILSVKIVQIWDTKRVKHLMGNDS